MSVDSWTPAKPDEGVDRALLEKGLKASREDQLEQLGELLSPEEQAQLRSQMQLPASTWSEVLDGFDSSELKALVRFFVRAEMLLPGCEAGEQSPAIWANRLLKQRGDRLTQDELRWIRENTNNRFIPNGPL